MAKFVNLLPDEIITDLEHIHKNTHNIFGSMTMAGAKTVYQNVYANAPSQFRGSNIMRNLMITRVYGTPSDGGINTKVGFFGYFVNEDGKVVPAPLVANMFEYGTSKKSYPSHPFMRRSFNEYQIRKAMLEEQKKQTGGLLNE